MLYDIVIYCNILYGIIRDYKILQVVNLPIHFQADC